MARADQCDHERLKQLLAESLPVATERALSEHLESCLDCQRELQSLAAADGWWSEASLRLSRSAVNQVSRRTTISDADDVAHFAADFAVDFLEPSEDPDRLGRLGEYEIVEVIGRGGMGIVLKGFQQELHRHVAVKVLSPHLATSGAARRRFAREAQATAAVVHPHVMAIHSVNADAKLPYLVMPFVPCQSLQERLDQLGPLDLKDILRIGMQAALGLAAAHAQGLVHRDVKPANILLETNVDRVLLTDFGLARAVDDATLTRTGIIAGTPQYMSPEQANGDAVDHRSDLFSLGSVLYAMCTRPPFRAETTFGVLRRIRETPPRSILEINPDIPVWFERIVLKLLEKEAINRPATAEAIASLLEKCLAHVQQPVTVSLPDEIKDWVQPTTREGGPRVVMHPRMAILAGVLLVLALAAGFLQALRPNDPAANAVTGSNVSTPEDSTRVPAVSSSLPDPSLQWNETQTELDRTRAAIENLAVELELPRSSTNSKSPLNNNLDSKENP